MHERERERERERLASVMYLIDQHTHKIKSFSTWLFISKAVVRVRECVLKLTTLFQTLFDGTVQRKNTKHKEIITSARSNGYQASLFTI